MAMRRLMGEKGGGLRVGWNWRVEEEVKIAASVGRAVTIRQ
jgi:hypothetical protein